MTSKRKVTGAALAMAAATMFATAPMTFMGFLVDTRAWRAILSNNPLLWNLDHA